MTLIDRLMEKTRTSKKDSSSSSSTNPGSSSTSPTSPTAGGGGGVYGNISAPYQSGTNYAGYAGKQTTTTKPGNVFTSKVNTTTTSSSRIAEVSQSSSDAENGARRAAQPTAQQVLQSNEEAVLQQRRLAPCKLEDFMVLQTVGTGSFGRVHLVRHRTTQKYLAMKVLKKEQVVRHKQVEHTLSEKKILEQIHHPFLVNLVGAFQDYGNLFMIMEYVCGGELFSYLRRSQRFSNNVAKFYAAEVALAFEYLHSKDIIYRDLKPENLLLDHEGHIKITDFGFAKYVPDVTWTVCGTPDYLAPEIIQSRGYGKAVDWYALGVLIFEMLAGHPPFYDEDQMRMYERILQSRIRWPHHFDLAAKDLLKRLLTPDLSKRYGNLRGGSNDIKRHRWFAGLDWNKLAMRQIPAPYVPSVQHAGDTSNFDHYPEERERYGMATHDPYYEIFRDF